MCWVKEVRRWLKCIHTGVTVLFFLGNLSVFLLCSSLVENLSWFISFSDTHAILVVTSPGYTLPRGHDSSLACSPCNLCGTSSDEKLASYATHKVFAILIYIWYIYIYIYIYYMCVCVCVCVCVYVRTCVCFLWRIVLFTLLKRAHIRSCHPRNLCGMSEEYSCRYPTLFQYYCKSGNLVRLAWLDKDDHHLCVHLCVCLFFICMCMCVYVCIYVRIYM